MKYHSRKDLFTTNIYSERKMYAKNDDFKLLSIAVYDIHVQKETLLKAFLGGFYI